ncbi:hypothetical protein QBZ16_004644 [Prototheca wickerhamii]|uniref:SCD domain-containing protein n=1 Tax=Prototheca wickerhamii TaxID=3111 RepID=A0AAD9IG69_PROWI|nr:hypothetical protein QBZ16_004644 [Prototheca wickerhamii]
MSAGRRGRAAAADRRRGRAGGGGTAARERRASALAEELLAYCDALFQGVAAHRFRDVCPLVRAAVVAGVGAWAEACPGRYLADAYLKYAAWALSDADAGVRCAALDALRSLYDAPGNAEALAGFTARFRDRFVELADDVDRAGVAPRAVALLARLRELGLVPSAALRGTTRLLVDPEPAVRRHAALLLAARVRGEGADNSAAEAPASRSAVDALLSACLELWDECPAPRAALTERLAEAMAAADPAGALDWGALLEAVEDGGAAEEASPGADRAQDRRRAAAALLRCALARAAKEAGEGARAREARARHPAPRPRATAASAPRTSRPASASWIACRASWSSRGPTRRWCAIGMGMGMGGDIRIIVVGFQIHNAQVLSSASWVRPTPTLRIVSRAASNPLCLLSTIPMLPFPPPHLQFRCATWWACCRARGWRCTRCCGASARASARRRSWARRCWRRGARRSRACAARADRLARAGRAGAAAARGRRGAAARGSARSARRATRWRCWRTRRRAWPTPHSAWAARRWAGRRWASTRWSLTCGSGCSAWRPCWPAAARTRGREAGRVGAARATRASPSTRKTRWSWRCARSRSATARACPRRPRRRCAPRPSTPPFWRCPGASRPRAGLRELDTELATEVCRERDATCAALQAIVDAELDDQDALEARVACLDVALRAGSALAQTMLLFGGWLGEGSANDGEESGAGELVDSPASPALAALELCPTDTALESIAAVIERGASEVALAAASADNDEADARASARAVGALAPRLRELLARAAQVAGSGRVRGARPLAARLLADWGSLPPALGADELCEGLLTRVRAAEPAALPTLILDALRVAWARAGELEPPAEEELEPGEQPRDACLRAFNALAHALAKRFSGPLGAELAAAVVERGAAWALHAGHGAQRPADFLVGLAHFAAKLPGPLAARCLARLKHTADQGEAMKEG